MSSTIMCTQGSYFLQVDTIPLPSAFPCAFSFVETNLFIEPQEARFFAGDTTRLQNLTMLTQSSRRMRRRELDM